MVECIVFSIMITASVMFAIILIKYCRSEIAASSAPLRKIKRIKIW